MVARVPRALGRLAIMLILSRAESANLFDQ
jgi:hypothetical protein